MSIEQAKDWSEIARQLEAIDATLNQGRGSSAVKRIIEYLKSADIEGARKFCNYDGDKLYQYPAAMEFIDQELYIKCGIKSRFSGLDA